MSAVLSLSGVVRFPDVVEERQNGEGRRRVGANCLKLKKTGHIVHGYGRIVLFPSVRNPDRGALPGSQRLDFALLFLQLSQGRLLFGQLILFLVDHGGRRLGDEAFIG